MAADFVRPKHSFFYFPTVNSPSEPVWHPPTDIYRTVSGWLVKCDLAGVNPDEVKVTLCHDKLSVSGVRRDFCLEEGCQHYQMEIAYSHFERVIQLPVAVDHAKICVENRQGMLLVRIDLEG